MTLKIIAIISQLVFYFYWLATEWIDLFQWNDLGSAKREFQIKGTIFHTTMMAICITTFLSGNKWLMGLAVIWITILLTVEICNWWIPYIFGVYPTEINKEVYAEHFSRTYRFFAADQRP